MGRGIDFLLVPLYLHFLAPEDYGALALLFLLSTFLKPVVRLGLDSGFFRIYYDLKSEERPRFANTVAWFAAGVSASAFVGIWVFAAPVSELLFGHGGGVLWVRLVAVDLLASSFVFVPFALFRAEGRASLLSTYSVIRHFANTVLKVILVLMGQGVTGVLISDAAASLLLALLLLFELRRRVASGFDATPLKETLRFGLPKVPHSVLVQILNLADRWILERYVSLADVGVYSVGNNFGGAMKFPLSAFEPAWQPFVFENARKEKGAEEIALIATRMAVLFTVTALALALLLPDVLIFVTSNPRYHAAAPVVPVIVLAFLFQGFFLLSSIGITIAKETRYYPLITAAAAALNVGLNLILIPVYGIMGSAWATVAGYALMAVLGARVSVRLYPLAVDWWRVSLNFAVALAAFVAGTVVGTSALGAGLHVLLSGSVAWFAWRFIYNEKDRGELAKVFGR
ncbi:MAG: oligosaccharide flippase family protein [Vicinamibacteria bacterium]|nr:oligosaccharide flippase family protein [Vicinamibacteria bacterium]